MKRSFLPLFLLLALAVRAEKNVFDVQYRAIPSDFESLLKTDAARWNFGFRPYGNGAAQLWTDPIVARDALAGAVDGEASGPKPTALYVACDDESFSFIVLCVEPEIEKTIASGKGAPGPDIEFFFAPGDTDNHDAEPYFQFYYGEGTFSHYPWQVEDRTWRDIKGAIDIKERRLPNGYLVKFRIPWEQLFDRLPFSGKKDAIWRLSVIRWSDGGRTWGGVVHQASRAGYIRFPNFSDADKARIMGLLLEKGWDSFNAAIRNPQYSVEGGWRYPSVRNEPYYLDQLGDSPRTYINYNEDPGFRPVLESLVAERLALGAQIAAFNGMNPREQAAFYAKASQMLFNFRYDVEEAYARHLAEKLLE